MKIKTFVLLAFSHVTIGVLGFAIGIFSLPILTAPPAPTDVEISTMSAQSQYSAQFKTDLKGSDFLHWGEGDVYLGETHITFNGKLSPGPDFKLYLSPEFVENEAEFEQLKSSMKAVGEVNTFNNFVVEVSSDIELAEFNTVIVWCESFGEFITSAKYQ